MEDIIKNRMYELAMSGKYKNWQGVKAVLLSENYTNRFLNDVIGISYLKEAITDVCKEYYK